VTTEVATGFHDRKTGLVVFGILTVLMGGWCAFGFVYLRSAKLMPVDSAPLSFQRLLPDPMYLALLAVALVWLGFGSMMARRWARALLLIFSWWVLLTGLPAMVIQAYVLQGIIRTLHGVASDLAVGPGAPGAQAMFDLYARLILTIGIVSGIVLVVLPAVGILFYRSRHVKATCEVRDPVQRWTDRCPLPVIGAGIWLLFASAEMLLAAVTEKSPMPFFGTFLTGPLVPALDVLLAFILAYSARAFYKLQSHGWWIATVTLAASGVSIFVTFLQHDTYEVLGSAEQVEWLERHGPELDRSEREALPSTEVPGSSVSVLTQSLKSPRFHQHEIAWVSEHKHSMFIDICP